MYECKGSLRQNSECDKLNRLEMIRELTMRHGYDLVQW